MSTGADNEIIITMYNYAVIDFCVCFRLKTVSDLFNPFATLIFNFFGFGIGRH